MSAKTSNQPGRRTPLSLTGGYSKGGQAHHNKGGGGGGAGGNSTHSSNGHNNYHKQDNNKNQHNNKTDQQQQTVAQKNQQHDNTPPTTTTKLQKKDQQNVGTNTDSKIPKPQQQNQHTSVDNAKSQKHQNHNDKKHQQQQQHQQQANGVTNSHKNAAIQTNKDKQQNEKESKTNEKANKKVETVSQEKPETKETVNIDKSDDEKDKNKEVMEKTENIEQTIDKKEEELKNPTHEENSKEQKMVTEEKKEENASENKTSNAAENDFHVKNNEKDVKDNPTEQMEVVDEISSPAVPSPQEQPQKEEGQMSAPPTPKSVRGSKPSTPNKPTPTKAEKTPQKSTPKREVTTCIDDFEMEPLNVDSSPSKEDEAPEPKGKNVAESAPCATSTPGKILLQRTSAKTDVQLAMQYSESPERPRAFSQISGRRAIRPITDYTPSKFQSNPQFRESYRRINTELDVTNTSMNVTVGSEIPNNSSFSFFSRGRKRERTPPQHSQSAIGELQTTEMDISPPKRARLDFFSVVSSPLSLLRNRFSKASLQSSTPVKLQQKMEEKEDDIEVQNVSGVSVHEDLDKTTEGLSECAAEDTSIAIEANDDNPLPLEDDFGSGDKELSSKMAGGDRKVTEDDDIKITETPLQTGSGDAAVKNKRCIVM